MSMIDPVTLALVKSALDAGALRQVAHANNIANAGTADYKPFAVTFEEGLGQVREAIASGTTSQLTPADIPAAHMFTDPAASAPGLDAEVASASENALQYQALTKLLGQQYALIGLAMSGGGK